MLDGLLECTKTPILLLNNSRKILHANEAAIKLFELTPAYEGYLAMDEPSNRKWGKYVEQIFKREVVEETFYIQTLGSPYQLVNLKGSLHSNKQVIIVQARPQNESEQVVQSLINKQNHSAPILHEIFNEIPYGMLISDENGIIIEINNNAAMLLKKEEHFLIQNSHKVIFDAFSHQNDEVNNYFNQLTNDKKASIYLHDELPNGRLVYLLVSSTYDEASGLVITSIIDETEKMDLQCKVEHQQSLNVVGQMAASIAHEIRNPMTSLKGFTDLLKLNANEESKMYLSIIDNELQRMGDILTQMLDLAKPVSNEQNIFELQSVVQQVVDFMMPDALMKNVVIQLDVLPSMFQVRGNQNRLKQVLINLIKNAIEAMTTGGTISIEISMENTSEVVVSIIDNGSGMSKDTFENLFLPFYTTKSTGTGLGLAFVKKVIEELNGEVIVESELNKGTTFRLYVPICQYISGELFEIDENVANYLLT